MRELYKRYQADVATCWPEAVVCGGEVVQQLWGGYGKLLRLFLDRAPVPSVVVKHIDWSLAAAGLAAHPRGWNGERSHQRKLQSYRVEVAFYQQWAQRCGDSSRVPRSFLVNKDSTADQVTVVLEDLDAAGFSARPSCLTSVGIETVLRWLADFHARFFDLQAENLWAEGTYWHLATRPDELAVMPASPLRDAATDLAMALRSCPFRTLVHGDAKVANFCFSANHDRVAAVDFQYVGGGIGCQDVVYFLGSVLSGAELSANAEGYWQLYADTLQQALAMYQPDVDARAVVAAWSELYPVAWADFNRFLAGWCPGHVKEHAYAEQQTALALVYLATLRN